MSTPPFRTALVVGLGKSGIAAATLLRDLGVDVRGYDRKPAIEDLPDGITPLLGDPRPPASAYAGIDLLVLSPGVPPQPFLAERTHWAPSALVHGELGLALSLVPEPRPSTVLVTGTNGKSTVTALTGALLEADGRTPFVGGNLGDPLAECVRACLLGEQAWPSELVLECSSYQLETLPPFPTAVAMVLNVTPDHIDRYATMADYADTKGRVFVGLAEGGLALLDDADAWTDALVPTRAGFRVVRVGRAGGVWLDDAGLHVDDDAPIPASTLRIAGRHNARNALFALAAARHLGVSVDACRRGLARFEGLPHRMRWIRELDGVAYYNDSKATNVTSAVAGLEGLPQPFVLIAGGLGKGDDLGPLRELLHARGRGLVAIGSAANEFLALAEGKLPALHASDLREAVLRARELAHPGDAVVLAPACASFDQFRSYAHRGEVFTEAVLALR